MLCGGVLWYHVRLPKILPRTEADMSYAERRECSKGARYRGLYKADKPVASGVSQELREGHDEL